MSARVEIQSGQRFEFGKNWSRFVDSINDERIELAEASLTKALGTASLSGKRFLDIGSGSGLFSLAARRLGAEVFSFDFDPMSVACTRYLRDKYFRDDSGWIIEEASVLDPGYMARHVGFDVVYSWGVLHHTGQLWQALAMAAAAVGPGGTLMIAIYNDQGVWSRRWLRIKRLYNALPRPLQLPYIIAVMGAREVPRGLWMTMRGKLALYAKSFSNYSRISGRGMSAWRDWVDWIGGYPFEVAKPEEVFAFLKSRGFELEALRTCAGGLGCNEYVLSRKQPDARTLGIDAFTEVPTHPSRAAL